MTPFRNRQSDKEHIIFIRILPYIVVLKSGDPKSITINATTNSNNIILIWKIWATSLALYLRQMLGGHF